MGAPYIPRHTREHHGSNFRQLPQQRPAVLLRSSNPNVCTHARRIAWQKRARHAERKNTRVHRQPASKQMMLGCVLNAHFSIQQQLLYYYFSTSVCRVCSCVACCQLNKVECRGYTESWSVGGGPNRNDWALGVCFVCVEVVMARHVLCRLIYTHSNTLATLSMDERWPEKLSASVHAAAPTAAPHHVYEVWQNS